jgi:sigma-B regulation protein RsbU (phosphoserine phosphatase)
MLQAGDDALMEAAAEHVLDGESFLATIRRCYASGTSAVDDEVLLRDGRVLDRHGRRIQDEDGNSLGFTWSFRDITSERAHQAEVAAAGERFATLARTLQQSLLPPSLPTPGGIELAARYHPAYQGIDVGGDFYDVFAVGDEWVLVIGDVCGKGAEAATLTALARYTIRAAAIHHADPAATLAELNTAMLAHADTGPRRFATVCCIRLRASIGGVAADIACGGHPLPVILRADGTIEAGGEVGTLLGVFETVHVTTSTVDLRPGDTVIAVTDGVLEARDESGRLLDQEGLEELVAPLSGRSADEIGAAIEDRALSVQNGLARDDIAVLVARILDPRQATRPGVPDRRG